MKNVLLAFIPVFVAVDALGVLPIFVSLTQGLKRRERLEIILQSMITAMGLAGGFILVGKTVFKFLGITISDFMIAGGALLFCIAIIDIVSQEKHRRMTGKDLGVVPLGTPLIAGPAVLTTSLIIISEYGLYPTLLAVFLNIVLAGLVFLFSEMMLKGIGDVGAKALSKITSLLLAAIAVMMVRKGVFLILG